jgi:hypothetical protein
MLSKVTQKTAEGQESAVSDPGVPSACTDQLLGLVGERELKKCPPVSIAVQNGPARHVSLKSALPASGTSLDQAPLPPAGLDEYRRSPESSEARQRVLDTQLTDNKLWVEMLLAIQSLADPLGTLEVTTSPP